MSENIVNEYVRTVENKQEEIMVQGGLVLEGGGMRGLYTAGILDYFLDKGLFFKNCYGVSAGAIQCCSYLSKQRGRAARIYINYMPDKRYASFGNLIKEGYYFGKEFSLKTIPYELEPYDFDTYNQLGCNFIAVATDCKTGEAAYHKIGDMRKDIEMDKLWATCSLPLISRMVEIDGGEYLDGGVTDSIPVEKAIEEENDKVVVILTRDASYRKKPASMMGMFKVKYRKYPNLIKAMEIRHERYNRTVELIEKLEAEGRIYVIRPKAEIEVGRLEKDTAKLTALYETGYKEAEEYYDGLKRYLGL